jgi:hypothetical protein
MIVAVDETGSFRSKMGQDFGVITIVTITDKEWEKFSSFLTKLFPTGITNIKGRLLTKEQREKVLKYIGAKPEV